MNSTFHKLEKQVADVLDAAVNYRRQLHAVPELAHVEEKSSAIVAEALRELDLNVRTNVGTTGIIANLETGRPGPLVVLRADMDALPVDESTDVPYRSQHPGHSHACGHDGHMAALIGAARVLHAMRDDLSGTVRFLFQPAEESASGARELIEEGAFTDRAPDAIIGLHAWPGLPTNVVACRPGIMMASTDAFLLEIRGKGGHSSKPANALNPLNVMAELIQELPKLSHDDRIITVCMARAGRAHNVIPELGMLSGTCRALSDALREQTRRDLEMRVHAICAKLGYGVKIIFQEGCPPLTVDERLYDLFLKTGKALGIETRLLKQPSMGAEDFAFYLEHGPGLMFRIGVGEESPYLHAPQFNFNDDALATGITMLAAMVIMIGETFEAGP